MSYLSTALLRAFEDLKLKQVEVAHRMGISPPQLNAYLHGRGPRSPRAFVRLYEQFPASHRGAVLRGYLLDRVPSPLAAKVRITVDAAGSGLPTPPVEPDADLDVALQFLSRESAGSREVRDLLLNLHRALLSAKATPDENSPPI